MSGAGAHLQALEAAGPGGRDLGLPRPARLGARARGTADAARGRSRSRSAIPPRPRSRRSDGWRWSTRKPASSCASTARAAGCASASRRSSVNGARPSPASCAGSESTTSPCPPTRTGSSSWDAGSDELRRPTLAVGAGADSVGAARAAPGAPAHARPTRCASRPPQRCSGRCRGPTPNWRRQLPIAALLAAVALIVAAIAAPRVTHRVPIRAASLMLVLDHSGSMASNDVAPTRLAAAIRAANTFIDQLPSSARVGVVGFSTSPDTAQQPGRPIMQRRAT